MIDEIFIKQMSPIDAYNYGRQMMEKEINKLGECEYNKGRADKYQEIVSEYMLLTEKQVAEIRADAIDELETELIDIILGNEEFTDWQKQEISLCLECAIEQLKEQK